ncbi:hypothetical protein CANINC_001511 [Pichia inconspicua]|uniref:ZIP zinc/iron transport family n=1 Tax=Pichia inconspicua TaxID=52247 RepID=A0A4T0X3R7_9ASCO|nr:hypothetical protein CANINC_001511 [[Candida] inconspicua]
MFQINKLISPGDLVELFVRDVDTCEADNEFNGEHMGARISAVFVVLIASAFGSFFPVLSSKYSFIRMPPVCFFVAKFFGSGVIVATAFIHLLEPANDSLSNECLGYPFDVYPFAFGICLIVIMLMFFLELIAYRWIESKISDKDVDINEPHSHSHFGNTDAYVGGSQPHEHIHADNIPVIQNGIDGVPLGEHELQILHLGQGNVHVHSDNHDDKQISNEKDDEKLANIQSDNSDLEIQIVEESLAVYSAQVLNVFILEFGIIFHSVFIGLTLACSGDEFVSLYIVICFHQMFEGLGLGTRVACVDWPRSKRWTPWVLCLGYTMSTPIAIAIGLGVRHSYPPGSRRALITMGVFDSVSAGILIYTGLIELMAHEFLFSDEFKGKGGFKKMIWAYLVMCTGAGVMALLGRWA